jgi:hypothetical protein
VTLELLADGELRPAEAGVDGPLIEAVPGPGAYTLFLPALRR